MKSITLSWFTFVIVSFSAYSQSEEGSVNVTSLFTNLGFGKRYSPISTGRSSSYLEETDIIPSQLGTFTSSLSYPSSLSATQFRQYYGKSPSVKIDSLSHSQPVGMAVTMPITASPWFYDTSGNVYGKNQLYPYYDNFDDHSSYYNSGKGGHVKSTASVIASVASLLSCLALAIPLLLIPLALALGAFLSLALILAVPVPVVTVNGGNGRVGNQKIPTTKKETKAIKEAFQDLMTKLPES